jgi:hypothetical protein
MSILRKLFLLGFFPVVAWAQSNLVVQSINKIQFADQFPGADACIQIQNAIAALPINGGEVDARGFLGFHNCSVNPFGNILNHPGESVHFGVAPALLSSSPAIGWFLPNPFLIFRNASVFSQLGGQNNGSFTYCKDCTVTAPSSCSTANPSACVCSGGGTGAFAKRLNGAWLCN